MFIEDSNHLLRLIEQVLNGVGINHVHIKVEKNPEREHLPCASFEGLSIWAFPRGGEDSKDLIWNVDYAETVHSAYTSPAVDIKEVISGTPVLQAIQAAVKFHLSKRLDYVIEMIQMEETAKEFLTGVK